MHFAGMHRPLEESTYIKDNVYLIEPRELIAHQINLDMFVE